MHVVEKKRSSESEATDHGFLYSYRSIPANKIIADPSYNRTISRKEVEAILKRFDSNLVNPCKVSFRDDKYYIFDGNHTLNALVEREGGNDSILVDCKVYQGMTKQDEARLFALQFGESRKVSSSYQIRALAVAKDSEVLRFVSVTETAGAKCSFKATNAPYHIKCYDTAFKIFQKRGEGHYFDVISTIIKAWNGHPQSLCKEIICGLDILLNTFPDMDKTRLVTVLSKEAPVEIIAKAKANISVRGNKRFAVQLGDLYNKRLQPDKRLNLIAIGL